MAPLLAYEAVDPSGRVERGERSAEDPAQLDGLLARDGLALVRVLGQRSPGASRAVGRARLSPRDLSDLAGYVAVTTRAGLSVVDSLADFGSQCEHPGRRAVLDDVVARLRQGETLGEAFARHPRSFGPLFLAMVRAGEEVGALDEAMDSAARQIRFQADVRRQVRDALVQPTILLTCVLGLVTLLITFLLPRLVGMLGSSGVALPAPTAFLMGLSEGLRDHALPVLAGLVLGLPGLVLIARRPAGRQRLGRLLLRLPVLGDMLWMSAQARAVSALATLLSSGVGAMRALRMAAESSGQPLMRAQLEQAAERVALGEPLGQALGVVERLHPLVVRMVQLGEAAGGLPQALGSAVAYFADELPRRIQRAVGLIQPALVIGSGLLVGFILLSALMPIFSLYEAL